MFRHFFLINIIVKLFAFGTSRGSINKDGEGYTCNPLYPLCGKTLK